MKRDIPGPKSLNAFLFLICLSSTIFSSCGKNECRVISCYSFPGTGDGTYIFTVTGITTENCYEELCEKLEATTQTKELTVDFEADSITFEDPITTSVISGARTGDSFNMEDETLYIENPANSSENCIIKKEVTGTIGSTSTTGHFIYSFNKDYCPLFFVTDR